jgi:hypothetical protein
MSAGTTITIGMNCQNWGPSSKGTEKARATEQRMNTHMH